MRQALVSAEHGTPYDYLNGCREPKCAAAREARVRAFCKRTGRPLPDDLIHSDRSNPAHRASRACDAKMHNRCRGWYGMKTGRRDGPCICECHLQGQP